MRDGFTVLNIGGLNPEYLTHGGLFGVTAIGSGFTVLNFRG